MTGLLCPGNETIRLIKDICNPCGTDDGLTHCSIGCLDANYSQRIGTFYPLNSTENGSVTNFTNCPQIWSNSKVTIQPVDYKTDYMHGIKVYASITAVISFFGIAFVFLRPNIHCAEGPGITVTKRILNNPDPRTWYKAIHLLMFYIIFIGTIIDSITDAYYFGRLESEYSLIHVSKHTINAMAAFLFFAMIKDYLCSGMTIDYYVSADDCRLKLDGVHASQLKTFKMSLSALLEDFVQVVMQYFFFEKYLMQPDSFVYINAILMLISSALFIKDLVRLYLDERQDRENDERCKTFTLIWNGLLAVSYQCARLAGVTHQMNRGGSLIKGACVEYDYETNQLIANPFNIRCLNPNDYLILITSALTVLGLPFPFFGECCCAAIFRKKRAAR